MTAYPATPLFDTLEPRLMLSGVTELEIPFALADDTNVSLIITDGDGDVVREVLRSEPMTAGAHTITWDGLDEEGEAVPAGDYTWKLLETDGLTAEFQFLVGTNPPYSPYADWVGDQAGATAIALDSTGIYVGTSFTENAPMLLKMSPDASSLIWDRSQFYDGGHGPAALATGTNSGGGEVVFMLQNFLPVVYRFDAGNPYSYASWTVSYDSYAPTDLDAFQTEFAIAYANPDKIRWYSNEGQILDEADVPSARAVTMLGDGPDATVLVATDDGKVVSLTRNNPTPVTVITGLTLPRKIDVDHTTGDIFIAEGGASQQVKRYSSAYALLNTYGTYGGRQEGLYVETDFSGITDITADGDGGFYIVESSSPRRVAHFDAATGQIIDDAQGRPEQWYGGQNFYSNYAVDPQNSQYLWGDSTVGAIVQYDVDWGNKTWDVHAVYNMFINNRTHGDGLYPSRIGTDSATKWEVYSIGGQTFLAYANNPAWLRVDEANGQLAPASIMGVAERKGSGLAGYPQPWVNAVFAAGYTDVETAPKHYAWADDDGDGVMDASEFALFPNSTDAINFQDGDITLDYGYVGVFIASGTSAYYDIPRIGWTGPNTNIPVYSWDSYTPGPPKPADFLSAIMTGVQRTPDGRTFTATFDNDLVAPRYGHEVFSNEVVSNRLGMFDADGNYSIGLGKTLWSPSQDGEGGWFFINQGIGDATIPGDTERAVFFNDRIRQGALAYTSDGLYIGYTLENRVDNADPDWVYQYGGNGYEVLQYDMLTGFLHEDPVSGDVYWIGAGQNDGAVYKITGLDNLSRQQGTVTLSAPADTADAEGTGLTALYYEDSDFTQLAGVAENTTLDADWGSGSPAGTPADGFAVRWVGQIEPPLSETYTFYAQLNALDGYRLYVDGALVIDSADGGASLPSGQLYLRAGQQYDIVAEFVDIAGDASVSFTWETANIDRFAIPQSHMYPASGLSISFDELAGSVLVDESSSGNEGRLVRADRVAGISGNGLYFNGADAFASVAANSAIAGGDAMTLSAWIKSDTATWTGSPVLTKGESYRLYATAGTKELTFEITSDQGPVSVSATPGFDITGWHHIAAVIDEGELKLYFDGVLANSTAFAGTMDTDDFGLLLGADRNLSTFWQGTMDGLRIDARARTETELADEVANMLATPLVRATPIDADASEVGPDWGVWRISRRGNTLNNLTVNFTFSGADNGSDFETLGTSVVIPAGQTYVDLWMLPILDGISETSETVILGMESNADYGVSTPFGSTIANGIRIADGDFYDLTETQHFDTDPADWNFVGLSTNDVNAGWSNTNTAEGIAAGEAYGDFNHYWNTWVEAGYVDTDMVYGTDHGLDKPYYAAGRVVLTNYWGHDSDGRWIAAFLDSGASAWTNTRGMGLRVDTGVLGFSIQYEGYFVDENIEIDLLEGVDAASAVNTVYDFEFSWAPGTRTLTGSLTPDGGATQTFSFSLTQTQYDNLAGSGVKFDRFGTLLVSQATPSLGETPASGAAFATRFDDITYGHQAPAAVNDVPVVRIEAIDPAAREVGADPAVFRLTRNDSIGPLTVALTYSGAATLGADFTSTHPTSVSFADGQDTVLVTVTPLTDSEFEFDDDIVVTIDPDAAYLVSDGHGSAEAIIVDDTVLPQISVSLEDSDAAEFNTNTGTFRFLREFNVAGDLTLNYTVTGSADAGDYVETLSGSILLPDGQPYVDVTITPVDDIDLEVVDTLTITLQTGAEYTLSGADEATLAIVDDDAMNGVNYDYYEGSIGTVDNLGTLTLVESGIVPQFVFSGNQAWDNFGFWYTGKILIFEPGAYTFYTNSDDGSKLFIDGNLVVNNDGAHAPQEQSGSITLTAGVHDIEVKYFEAGGGEYLWVGYEGPGISKQQIPTEVLYSDQLAETVVNVTASDPIASEAGDTATFTFSRPVPNGDVTVHYSMGGTAEAGTDYTALAGSVTIPDTQKTADVVVTLLDDAIYDPGETIVVAILGDAGYTLGSHAQATVTTIDDDPAAVVDIAATDPNASEIGPDAGQFVFTRSGNLNGDITVRYAVGGSATAGALYEDAVLALDPLGYWRLNGNANDATANGSDGTWLGSEAYTTGASLFNETGQEAASFDETRYIEFSNESIYDFEHTDPFSFSFWARSTNNGQYDTMVAKRAGNVGNAPGISIMASNSGRIHYFITAADGTTLKVDSTKVIRDGEWHHIVATYDGSQAIEGLQVYVDGVFDPVTVHANNLNTSSSIQVDAGVSAGANGGNGSEAFNGDVDELAVYDRVLSAQEIAHLYAVATQPGQSDILESLTGSVVIPDGQTSAVLVVTPFNDQMLEGLEDLTLSLVDDNSYDLGAPVEATVTITDAGVSTVTLVATDPDASEIGPDAGEFTISRGTDADGDLTVRYEISGIQMTDQAFPDTVSALGPVGYWRLNGDATDATGNGQDGVWFNGESYVDGAPIGPSVQQAGSFDNVSYVQLPNESAFDFGRSDPFTITSWIRTTTSGQWDVIAAKREGSGDMPGYFLMLGGSGQLHTYFGGNSAKMEIDSTTTVNDGHWHMVTMTYDGSAAPSGVKLYIDGKVDATTTVYNNLGTGDWLNDAPVGIGARGDGGEAFAGDIDEVAIYDRALSAQEIQSMFLAADQTGSGDIVEQLTGEVVIPDGESSVTLPITPFDDLLVEGEETITLTLVDQPQYDLGASTSGTVTIEDAGYPTLSIVAADPAGYEDGPDIAAFTVHRAGNPTDSLTFFYEVTGSADAGDYVETLTGVATIPAGETSIDITITPVEDFFAEGVETLTLTLVDAIQPIDVAAWYRGGEANGGDPTILVDSSDSGKDLDAYSGGTPELGVGGGALAGSSAVMRFDGDNSQDGFGAMETPYAQPAMTATDNFAMEAWVYVEGTRNDNADENIIFNGGSGGYQLSIYNGQWAAHYPGIIRPTYGAVTLNQWRHVAMVRDSGATTFYLDGVAQAPTFTQGPNTPSRDQPGYTWGGFSIGSSYMGTHDVVWDNTEIDGMIDEVRLFTFDPGTFTTDMLLLEGVADVYAVDAGADQATVTIADGAKPTVSITATDANAAEANTDPGTFTVTRTTTVGDLAVQYVVSGSADAGDVQETLTGSVVIPDGQTSAIITVTPVDDTENEGDETLTLTVVDNGAFSIGTPADADVTIVDNDAVPTPTITFVSINHGWAQRSNVEQVQISFSSAWQFEQMIAAGTIAQEVQMFDASAPTTPLAWLDASRFSWDGGSNTLTIDLTQAGASDATKLADGRYEVRFSTLGHAVDRSTGSGSQDLFRLAGDLDGSADVDLTDLALLAANWNQPNPALDVDGEGVVDLIDLAVMANNWNKTI